MSRHWPSPASAPPSSKIAHVVPVISRAPLSRLPVMACRETGGDDSGYAAEAPTSAQSPRSAPLHPAAAPHPRMGVEHQMPCQQSAPTAAGSEPRCLRSPKCPTVPSPQASLAGLNPRTPDLATRRGGHGLPPQTHAREPRPSRRLEVSAADQMPPLLRSSSSRPDRRTLQEIARQDARRAHGNRFVLLAPKYPGCRISMKKKKKERWCDLLRSVRPPDPADNRSPRAPQARGPAKEAFRSSDHRPGVRGPSAAGSQSAMQPLPQWSLLAR